LELNPSSTGAWIFGGYVRNYRGEGDKAIEYFENAMSLSPRDPFPYFVRTGIALAHCISSRFQEAVMWARKAERDNPNFSVTLRVLAASYAQLGQLENAKATLSRLLNLSPDLTIARLRQFMPYRPGAYYEPYIEGLRVAGLPDR
jgi:tetratricopeptide (TPR) repeat protein